MGYVLLENDVMWFCLDDSTTIFYDPYAFRPFIKDNLLQGEAKRVKVLFGGTNSKRESIIKFVLLDNTTTTEYRNVR